MGDLNINVKDNVGLTEQVGPGGQAQPRPLLFNVVEVYFEGAEGERKLVSRTKLEKNVYVPAGASRELKVKVRSK